MAVSVINGEVRCSDIVNGNYCHARRVGNIVEIVGSSDDFQIGSTGYKAVGTLPEIYRPSDVIRGLGDAMGGTPQVLVHVTLDGAVQLYATQNTSYWEYDVVYLVD